MGDTEPGLAATRVRLEQAAAAAGRKPGDVTLIAVSKTFPAAAIAPLISQGQRVFGENRVQEAQSKWPALKAATPGIELHLIGPLQTNKAKDAVDLFDVIQTLDRERLAAALARAMKDLGRRPRLFVQVNTGAEPQKAGIDPREASAFVDRCRKEHGLAIEGLMCIPPIDEAPGPHFALLRDLAERTRVDGLSMGMSADFETAIGFGATHVRVGSAIFGARAAA